MTQLNEAGPSVTHTINGTDLFFADRIDPTPTRHQSKEDSAAGRPIFTAKYVAEYYPDFDETYEFQIPTRLTDGTATEQATLKFLKKLRKRGGVHTLALWTYEPVFWTAVEGQALFYLPRRDAADAMGKSEATFPVRWWVGGEDDGVAYTVVMKDNVAEDDTVPAATVWVGRENRLCKIGTAIAADDTIVECHYVPMYRVVVLSAPSEYRSPGVEPIVLTLSETTEE